MNNQLQGKDLINIGIFTAIYFIIIFAAASIGFIPIFIPLISVIVPDVYKRQLWNTGVRAGKLFRPNGAESSP